MADNADQDRPESTSGAKSRAGQLRSAVEGATAKPKPKSKPKRA